jgi:hypothetical protein
VALVIVRTVGLLVTLGSCRHQDGLEELEESWHELEIVRGHSR